MHCFDNRFSLCAFDLFSPCRVWTSCSNFDVLYVSWEFLLNLFLLFSRPTEFLARYKNFATSFYIYVKASLGRPKLPLKAIREGKKRTAYQKIFLLHTIKKCRNLFLIKITNCLLKFFLQLLGYWMFGSPWCDIHRYWDCSWKSEYVWIHLNESEV